MAVVARRSRFARPERERRFLVAPHALPHPGGAEGDSERREIHDRYLDGTRLRLRRVVHPSGDVDLKLTQKIPGEPWGQFTTTYLSQAEYDVLRVLPAATLTKVRHRAGMAYDACRGPLNGLVLAEVEFDDDEAAAAYAPPSGHLEVTRDLRFTGGRLAYADAASVLRAARELIDEAR